MRKMALAFLTLLISFVSIPQAQGAATTPQLLAKKVAKTGKGCDGKLIIKTELLGGKTTECKYNGEPLTITVYQAKTYNAAIKMACTFDLGIITVTDGKTWIVSPSSRSAANALAKPLGGKVKVLCNRNNIINETYQPENSDESKSETTSTPEPTTSPTPTTPKAGSLQLPYKLGETVKVGDFNVNVLSIDEKSSQQVCIATGGYGDLCSSNYNGNTESEKYFVKPGINKKYVLFEIVFTNQGKETSAPGFSLAFKFTDQNGALLSETYIGDLNATNTSLIPGGVSKTKIGFILDQNVDTAKLMLSISPFFGDAVYFATR